MNSLLYSPIVLSLWPTLNSFLLRIQDGIVERGEALPAGGLGARLRLPLHPALPRRHGNHARGPQQLRDANITQLVTKIGGRFL